MRRSVLHVITDNGRRGAEVFAVDLAHALTAGGRPSRVVSLTPASGPGETLPVPALGRRPLAPSTIQRLRRAASTSPVVAHGSSALPACAVATAFHRAPFVYRSIGDPRFWVSSRSRRARVGVFLRRARAVVALWPAAADALVAQYGLRPEAVRVIPNGVPAERFPPIEKPRRSAARAQLGLGDDEPVVACIGALSPEKDIGAAIAAVASIPPVRLLVVGGGPQRPALERLAQERAHGRISFHDPTDEPALFLAAADVLVLPSRSEGLPAVLIEAGLSALPVVACDVGGVREIVEPDVTGLLVPPDDFDALTKALRAVLENPRELGAAARRRCIERFEMSVVASAWDQLLAEIN